MTSLVPVPALGPSFPAQLVFPLALKHGPPAKLSEKAEAFSSAARGLGVAFQRVDIPARAPPASPPVAYAVVSSDEGSEANVSEGRRSF